METKVYTLKRKKDTNELHLFECNKTQNSCTCNQKSMCGKMSQTEQIGSNKFSCEYEHSARMKAAEIGREVCGDCIIHLYKTK